jgi:hypothetical protein
VATQQLWSCGEFKLVCQHADEVLPIDHFLSVTSGTLCMTNFKYWPTKIIADPQYRRLLKQKIL